MKYIFCFILIISQSCNVILHSDYCEYYSENSYYQLKISKEDSSYIYIGKSSVYNGTLVGKFNVRKNVLHLLVKQGKISKFSNKPNDKLLLEFKNIDLSVPYIPLVVNVNDSENLEVSENGTLSIMNLKEYTTIKITDYMYDNFEDVIDGSGHWIIELAPKKNINPDVLKWRIQKNKIKTLNAKLTMDKCK